MIWSFLYLALCRLVQLVVLLCRSERVGFRNIADHLISVRVCVISRAVHSNPEGRT